MTPVDIDGIDALQRAVTVGEFDSAAIAFFLHMVAHWPPVSAELRELRRIAEDHDCLAFPWANHAPSQSQRLYTAERELEAAREALATMTVDRDALLFALKTLEAGESVSLCNAEDDDPYVTIVGTKAARAETLDRCRRHLDELGHVAAATAILALHVVESAR